MYVFMHVYHINKCVNGSRTLKIIYYILFLKIEDLNGCPNVTDTGLHLLICALGSVYSYYLNIQNIHTHTVLS